jgi:hypothetical protein
MSESGSGVRLLGVGRRAGVVWLWGVLAAVQGLVFWQCPINRLPINCRTAELPVGNCYRYRQLVVFHSSKHANDVAKRE